MLSNKTIRPFGKDYRNYSIYFFSVCLPEEIFLNLYKLSPNLHVSVSGYLTNEQFYEAVKLLCEVLQWLDNTTVKKDCIGSLPVCEMLVCTGFLCGFLFFALR